MLSDAFTARNATKFIVKSIVAHKTKGLVAATFADYTEYEEDAFGVQLGASVVGWAVSDKLKPVSDKIVDVSFDFVAERRNKRQLKKEIKQNQKED